MTGKHCNIGLTYKSFVILHVWLCIAIQQITFLLEASHHPWRDGSTPSHYKNRDLAADAMMDSGLAGCMSLSSTGELYHFFSCKTTMCFDISATKIVKKHF